MLRFYTLKYVKFCVASFAFTSFLSLLHLHPLCQQNTFASDVKRRKNISICPALLSRPQWSLFFFATHASDTHITAYASLPKPLGATDFLLLQKTPHKTLCETSQHCFARIKAFAFVFQTEQNNWSATQFVSPIDVNIIVFD